MVELMIAVVLGAIVVGGLINLFVANKKAYQMQSGNNFLQENLRVAADRISWSARMADFWGGNQIASVTGSGSSGSKVTAKGNCTGAWATKIVPDASGGGGVYGYDGASSFPIDSNCIDDAANYVPGSDVLVLRYAEPQSLSPGPADATTPAVSATVSSNAKAVFLLSTPGVNAQLFSGSVPTTTTAKLQRYVHPFQVDVYYLRPCAVISAGAACSAKDDGGNPLPTLMRMHLNLDGTFTSDPIVTGIEQLKFEYGVVTNPTDATPTYKSASSVTSAGQWANVVSVRMTMVAVNPTRDVAMPHTATLTLPSCTYVITNGGSDVSKCSNFTPFGDKPWQFARSTLQQVAQLRNRIRG
jgi:Tfp pilus assembly protein PilW